MLFFSYLLFAIGWGKRNWSTNQIPHLVEKRENAHTHTSNQDMYVSMNFFVFFLLHLTWSAGNTWITNHFFSLPLLTRIYHQYLFVLEKSFSLLLLISRDWLIWRCIDSHAHQKLFHVFQEYLFCIVNERMRQTIVRLCFRFDRRVSSASEGVRALFLLTSNMKQSTTCRSIAMRSMHKKQE